jgi:hypothetical protein
VAYVQTDGGEMYDDTTEINADRYPWNGMPGLFTLAAGEEFILHVSSEFRETTIDGLFDIASRFANVNCLREATSDVSVDDSAESSHIKISGGRIKTINDSIDGDKAEASQGSTFWIIC